MFLHLGSFITFKPSTAQTESCKKKKKTNNNARSCFVGIIMAIKNIIRNETFNIFEAGYFATRIRVDRVRNHSGVRFR